MSLGYALFVAMSYIVYRHIADTADLLGLHATSPFAWLRGSVSRCLTGGPLVRSLLLVLLIAWVRSGSASRFQAGKWSWLWVFPWMRSILSSYETANFSELLGLLLGASRALSRGAGSRGRLHRRRPTVQGGPSTCRRPRAGRTRRPAGRVDRGNILAHEPRLGSATGQDQGSLVAALRNLSDVYRKRAQYQADKLAVFLPTILMIAIGATATLCYGLRSFIPLSNLLRELAVP